MCRCAALAGPTLPPQPEALHGRKTIERPLPARGTEPEASGKRLPETRPSQPLDDGLAECVLKQAAWFGRSDASEQQSPTALEKQVTSGLLWQ